MWIRFEKLGKPVLANVQKIALEKSTDGSGGIVDLGVEDSVNLLSGLTSDVICELGGEEYDDFNQDPRITSASNSGELEWYNDYERAKEVFNEIQQAIIAGKTYYEMPKE